jgi:hypothetical protein
MAEFKFDHSKQTMNEALGLDKAYIDALSHKTMAIIEDTSSEEMSTSIFVEKSLVEFSYNELVILSGMFLAEKYLELREAAVMDRIKNIKISVLGDLKDIDGKERKFDDNEFMNILKEIFNNRKK